MMRKIAAIATAFGAILCVSSVMVHADPIAVVTGSPKSVTKTLSFTSENTVLKGGGEIADFWFDKTNSSVPGQITNSDDWETRDVSASSGLQHLSLMMKPNTSTPELTNDIQSHVPLTVTITETKPGIDPNVPPIKQLQFVLTHALVTQIQGDKTASGPAMTITLSYTKISYKYVSNSAGGTITPSDDWETPDF